ncbi:hypothetical protein AC249_AIPGENE6600, partial [Exaiptasia diaphana]
DTLRTEDLVAGSAGDAVPAEGHALVAGGSRDVGRGRCDAGATVGLHGRRGAGDLLVVEGRVDGRHMRRAIVQVAVVVVGGQVVLVTAVARATAATDATGEPVADRAGGDEGQAIDDFVGGVVVVVEGRALQLALPQGPHGLGVDAADTVHAAATVGVGPGVVVGLTGLALQIVDVAHAGAGSTGITVAGADGAAEVPADAGGVEAQGGVDVSDTLTRRAGDGALDVEVVHAMAPLVIKHAGDLTGVGAAAAGAVEVHRRSVPERVAGAVDIHVGGQATLEPGV